MEKIDPHNHREHYLAWKARVAGGIPGISAENSRLILRYLSDMETGLNGQGKKGPRSFIRLKAIKDHCLFFARQFESRLGISRITDVSEDQLHQFFSDMRLGVMRKSNGTPYQSVPYYVKDFKSLWHWHARVAHRDGIHVPDITTYLDAAPKKPAWVYIDEKALRRLCAHARHEYRALMMFLFDSGIRAPTELVNVRVRDFTDDFRHTGDRWRSG